MASKYQDEQEKLREKRELLKLKQGIIDESDVIDEYQISHDYKELNGKEKVENFWYHYKWYIIILTIVAIFVGIMVYQTVTREKQDLYVLAVSTSPESGLYLKTADIEEALEKYCPDFDGNGYVHVGINYIDKSNTVQLSDADNYKFSAELYTGDSQLYISDQGIVELINNIAKGEIEFFIDLTEEYPDSTFYEGKGLQVNTTDFAQEAKWMSCPDIVGLYVRSEFVNMTGDKEDSDEQRRRAMIVIDNIINGNIVNPDVVTEE